MKSILLISLCAFPVTAAALELFGVNLAQATQQQLRGAVKQAGAGLLREAGKDGFFDVYESDRLLPDSSSLYLGFVKKNARFAFAEYEFNGLKQPGLIDHLQQKYGKPQVVKGRFLTDLSHRWEADGITIAVYVDWQNYKTRLAYYQPQALQQLRTEMQRSQSAQPPGQKPFLAAAY